MRKTKEGQNLNLESQETLIQVADKLVISTFQIMRTAKTEEGLQGSLFSNIFELLPRN